MESFISLKGLYIKHRSFVETIGRYLVAGGIGAITNLGILYILTEYAGFHYLVSAGISFVLACGVGFTLQKFWTFRDRSVDGIHAQALGYFTISSINFFLNIALLYLLVEWMHIWYIFAQVIASGLIAVSSFLLYRHVIFLQKK